jgi:hypothetical protein
MHGTDYWLRQQISLEQWRDYYKVAERDRQVDLELASRPQRTGSGGVRITLTRILHSLRSWFVFDDPRRSLEQRPVALLESSLRQ